MKTKIFGSLIAGAFLLILLATFASAAIEFKNSAGTVIPSSGISQSIQAGNTATVSFKLTEDGYGTLTNMSFNVPLTLTSGTNTFASSSTVSGMITSLLQSQTSGLMSLSFAVPSTQAAGVYTGDLILSGDYTSGVTYTLPITLTVTEAPKPFSFCEWDDGVSGNPGDLSVKISDVSVTGIGDNEKMLPFDEAEVKVEVKNRGDDDINDVSVEWGLYDKKTGDWVIEPDEVDQVDINNGKTKTFTFTFTIDDSMDVDLQDLEDGSNYLIYVRATGDVDNVNNDPTCTSDSESVDLVIENDFVVLTNFETPETVQCGSDLQIGADAWNIGSDDQDSVSVKITNKELGISKTFDVGDINSFDSQSLDATVSIPKNAQEKSYVLTFEVLDDNGDVYQADYEDTLAKFTKTISVQGSCSTSATTPKAVVTAKLASGGKAGQSLVITATITNTGDKTAQFLLNPAGFAGWANSGSVDPKTLTLNAGQSGIATFTLDVKKDAVGDNTFNIEVVSDNQLVVNQPVSATIEKSQFNLSGVFGDSWYLWLLGIINVILVVVIIIVAVKVARK